MKYSISNYLREKSHIIFKPSYKRFHFFIGLSLGYLISYIFFTKIENYNSFKTIVKESCQIINENYKFEQVEIDGVKYPKYDYDTHLVDKYNYSCLNRLSKQKKRIFFWYKPEDRSLIGDKTPIGNCPITNCEFYDDIKRINESHAVLVDFFVLNHRDNVRPENMSVYRNPDQKWVKNANFIIF